MPESPLSMKLVERICALQRGLDQAMATIHDLSHQVQHQHLVEHQLGVTEQFANVQQQMIASLLHQLEDRYNEHHHTQADLMTEALATIQTHQTRLQRLQTTLVQSQLEVQAYLGRLQPQTAIAPWVALHTTAELYVARTLAVNLATLLQTAQHHLAELWTLMHRYALHLSTIPTPDPSPATIAMGRSPHNSSSGVTCSPTPPLTGAIASTLVTLNAMPQSRITELEAQLAEQLQMNAQLKHRYQELAAERDYYKAQAQSLHQQNAEMQEYVLHQADVVDEQKIAIQYWKDQVLTAQPWAV